MSLVAREAAAATALKWAARSHAGRVRPFNEDRVLEADGVWAVADGMGGLEGGAEAAEALTAALRGVTAPDAAGQLEALCTAVDEANASIFASGRGRAGATLVLLLVRDGHFACAWAGDSRAYLLRDGRLLAVTHDHSPCQALVDAGLLSEEARRAHPHAHVVSRAVGVAPRLELERRFGAVEPGDVFLLCSDGLTACLGDAELAAHLAGSPEMAADALLAAALARGAPDNVSLVVVGSRR